jgi:hypothetical protein
MSVAFEMVSILLHGKRQFLPQFSICADAGAQPVTLPWLMSQRPSMRIAILRQRGEFLSLSRD